MPRPITYLGPLLLALLSSACSVPSSEPLEQQVYIWQRQWQPSHAEALARTRTHMSTLRVLALQGHPQGGWARAYPDLPLLIRDGRPVIAVVRLDGQLPQLDQAEIGARIDSLLADWRSAGLQPVGLEIDHDCATARLPGYVHWLQALRERLPQDIRLSITALPAWLDSPHLDALLASVDSSVLQVHAVSDPRAGLFDAGQARRWARRYAERSPTPFFLALPAYGVALLDSPDGLPLVESEVTLPHAGARHELRAEPQAVAGLIDGLRGDALRHLAGIVWFRLPLPGDRRAWPMPTLLAVIDGQPLQARVELRVDTRDAVQQLFVDNNGTLEAELPARLEIAAGACDAADALPPYRLQRTADALVFTRQRSAPLAAGHSRPLGWARCRHLDQGTLAHAQD
ncbi:DUF3142 domain-containing protein [Phytopseudomonas dryadis]|uniref:DUF3142 domain-containing protein n=1 Tax=Phytopseudomonas dryadis TaxID=2487520 RepID=A0A4Q9QQS9_9GAMM|nr:MULTISPECIES: DUF3142 domain-containing protein [Pseudomonas]TBU82636.1 DUF3142 domain-containing protein [Pseudomonas dryadis]TBV07665.1 DUF3142 domain-containing protein [Pseudomonas dryadis]TBV19907.1 DUF3142 domain-containing protein [Pseudomonas sp. FRB 230]